MKNEIKLEMRPVGEISGHFFVPSYQRGYRWSEKEVGRLLDDVWENGARNYCLQPIVVQRREDGSFELIDGQQRLTTLYLIYKYLASAERFSITYQTRPKTKEYLESIDESKKEENIDFFFIAHAFQCIRDWFSKKEHDGETFRRCLSEHVQVIWYEVGTSAAQKDEAIDLFTRLNIGKIPLTSSELVKAMFLRRGATENDEKARLRQDEIALQWDAIERELRRDRFWSFLTNSSGDDYPTRIDLVLDLMANKEPTEREHYYTFFHFDKKMKEGVGAKKLWEEINAAFLRLKDWAEDRQFYHKIGYLIASGSLSLQEIYNMSESKTKSEFREMLDAKIRESLKFAGNRTLDELSYESGSDRGAMSRLLLLFNVISVMENESQADWFPFEQFKKSGSWSLEHIHAQHSEGLKTKKEWQEWLKLHRDAVKALRENANADLLREMEAAAADENLTRETFESLQQRAIACLSKDSDVGYLHLLSNMALLSCSDNAALNNSAFAVKRQMIIDLDKAGSFIPHCTKMVFFKYYTSSEDATPYFWGEPDRQAYMKAIREKLKAYLSNEQPISEEN